jgi:hypothetical protein
VSAGEQPGRQRWLFLARLLSAGVGVLAPAWWVYVGGWFLLTEPEPEPEPGITTGIPLQMGLVTYVIAPALIVAFAVACWRPRAGVVAVWVGLIAYIGLLTEFSHNGWLLAAAVWAGPLLLGAVPLTVLARVAPRVAAQ